eukprot:2176941-Amphidinium_carterae.1
MLALATQWHLPAPPSQDKAGADIVDMAGAAAMVGAIDIVVAVDITGAAVEMVGTVAIGATPRTA